MTKCRCNGSNDECDYCGGKGYIEPDRSSSAMGTRTKRTSSIRIDDVKIKQAIADYFAARSEYALDEALQLAPTTVKTAILDGEDMLRSLKSDTRIDRLTYYTVLRKLSSTAYVPRKYLTQIAEKAIAKEPASTPGEVVQIRKVATLARPTSGAKLNPENRQQRQADPFPGVPLPPLVSKVTKNLVSALESINRKESFKESSDAGKPNI